MNEIVSKFLLAGDKFLPEMHLSTDLPTVVADHLLKTKKEKKNLRKQEICNIFLKMNWTKPPFSMTWLM